MKDELSFKEFSPVSTQAWEARIKKDLRGADYKTKLKWHTGEGIDALPFYRQDDTARRPPMQVPHQWEIRQQILASAPGEANTIAREALAGGADAVQFCLRVDDVTSPVMKGVSLHSPGAISTLLADIDITQTALHFDAGWATPVLLSQLATYCNDHSVATDNLSGTVLFDPYTAALITGQLPAQPTHITTTVKELSQFCSATMSGMRPLGINAAFYHHLGGTIVQEIAYALSTASDYFAAAGDAADALTAAANSMHFTVAVGSNYFLEIAKIRALRMLWGTLCDAYGIDDAPPAYIHATTSQWNKTAYEPYVNMLRTSTEGMSAAIAGCNAITVLPFDAAFRASDAFSRRIARNSQIILKEEAYLNKVADPAAGSYYIEHLTDKLAEQAWQLFQKIEEQGGLYEAILDGSVQQEIKASRSDREQRLATRERVFVGINRYPNAEGEAPDSEQPVSHHPLEKSSPASVDRDSLMASIKDALEHGASWGSVISGFASGETKTIEQLVPYRASEPFEKIRKATERHAQTPTVLTLPLGDKKMRKARSAFATNFFGCAGYDITDPIGFDSVGAAVEQIENQQPDIVVLCSANEAYPKLVPKLCSALKDASANPLVVLAGDPGEHRHEFETAGVDAFIHTGTNVLESLTRFQKQLRVMGDE